MRIAIDAHQVGARSTGSETYVYNLVKHLALLEPNGEKYDIYLNAGQSVEATISNPNFRTRIIRTSIGPLRFGCFFPAESWRKRFDVFHAQYGLPPLLRSKTVVTIYDLTYERFPQFFRRRVRAQMRILVRESCSRANHVITISESSKRDLVEFYDVDPKKVSVTYPAAGEGFKPQEREKAKQRLQREYGLEAPFLLYVGNLEPRKNLPRLIEAYTKLRRKNMIPHKLVIVGQKAWLYGEVFETVRAHRLEHEVIFTGYVPTEDLPSFYCAASVMVYPSIFEGFGLPVVEAMACGTPVVTSVGSSLEEIAGGTALLVDPLSVSSIESGIERVASDAELQARLRNDGLARAAQFSYVRMAEQTRSIYHQL